MACHVLELEGGGGGSSAQLGPVSNLALFTPALRLHTGVLRSQNRCQWRVLKKKW
jgi:hypothetical protein